DGKDPYRDAVRDAVLANDRAKLAELAGQPAALEQPPGFVAFLGESADVDRGRRRELLRAAGSRRPGELGLLTTLGTSCSTGHGGWADERLRWFHAAVAAAPGNAAALNDLGTALNDKGRSDEAIAYYRKAIEADPTLANPHTNLGLVLRRKGRLD